MNYDLNLLDELKITLRSVVYIFLALEMKPEQFNEAMDHFKKDYLRNYNKEFSQNE